MESSSRNARHRTGRVRVKVVSGLPESEEDQRIGKVEFRGGSRQLGDSEGRHREVETRKPRGAWASTFDADSSRKVVSSGKT